MNILMLSYEFPPLGGGGASVVYGLSRELVRAGHSVEIVTMGFRGLAEREDINGAKVYRVRCIRKEVNICRIHELVFYVFAALPLVLKLVKEKKYDINHTHFIFPDGVLAFLVRKLCGLRYVITAHGSDVPGYNSNRFKLAHKLLSPIWKKVVRDVEEMIFPSTCLQTLFRKHSPKKGCVIPNGIRQDKYRANAPKDRKILVVTRMFERKGVQYFLRALDGLDIDYGIHIVGDGPYAPILRRMADQLNITAKFWGWLDNASPELKELFETSRIFVFTSEAENFPIVLLEAMSAGLAIITTKGTGCSEVVGDDAVIIEARNAEAIRQGLIKLTGDPALCARLGKAQRKRVEDYFTWATIGGRYAEFYKKYARPQQAIAAKAG